MVQQIKYKGLRIVNVIYGTLMFGSLTEVKSIGLAPNKVCFICLIAFKYCITTVKLSLDVAYNLEIGGCFDNVIESVC